MKSRKLILTVAVIAAVAALALIFAPGNRIDTPSVLLPETTAAPVPGTEPGQETSGPQAVAVTAETAQAVLGWLSRADSYSRTVLVLNLWDGGGSERSIDVLVRGESERLTVSGAGGTKNILIVGDELWLWYDDDSAVYHGPADQRAADEYQAILTYEDVLALPPEAILDAGYDSLEGEQCIRVDYVSGALGYRHRVWVSTETGLLMASESYDGDTLVSRMVSTTPEISTPDESAFTHP